MKTFVFTFYNILQFYFISFIKKNDNGIVLFYYALFESLKLLFLLNSNSLYIISQIDDNKNLRPLFHKRDSI